MFKNLKSTHHDVDVTVTHKLDEKSFAETIRVATIAAASLIGLAVVGAIAVTIVGAALEDEDN